VCEKIDILAIHANKVTRTDYLTQHHALDWLVIPKTSSMPVYGPHNSDLDHQCRP
jgi:hypothetical protein